MEIYFYMISIITINYKTKDYLGRLLESLFRIERRFEMIVVENGSGDDLSQMKTTYPTVKWIDSQKNLGFAGGCNLALAQVTGDYVLLLNPDVEFDQPILQKLEEYMNRDGEVGVAGIRMANLDGTLQPSVRRFPKPIDQLLLLLKIPHLFPGVLNSWLWSDFDYDKTQDTEQVMGAFMCVRKTMIEKVGFLDPRFFMWYEEVDLCKRAYDAGWKIRYYHDLSVRHKKGASFDRVATWEKQAMLRRSIRYYIRKHFGIGWWLAFCIGEPLFILGSVIASVAKPKV